MDLTSQLNQVAEHEAASNRGNGKTAFLRHLPSIEDAIAAGHKRHAIWALLHEQGHIPIGYRQFQTYLAQFLPQAKGTVAESAPVAAPTAMTLTLDIAMPMNASGAPIVEVKGLQPSSNGTNGPAPAAEPPEPIDAEPPAVSIQEADPAPSVETLPPAPESVPHAIHAAVTPDAEWDNQAFKKRDQLY